MKVQITYLNSLFFILISLILSFNILANENIKSNLTVNYEPKQNINSACSELKKILSPIQNLQGDFEQSLLSEGGKVLQRLSGKMHLKKPGQFRWEIIKPEPRLVVSNGKSVWDYDKELEQVTIQKAQKSQSKTPIYFLTGEVESLDKDFIIIKFNMKNQMNNQNTQNNQHAQPDQKNCLISSDVCFELKPKKGEGSFQWIRIGFKNNKLQELVLLDQLGQKSYFVFKNIQINQSLSDNLYQFVPPKGVDVLENK